MARRGKKRHIGMIRRKIKQFIMIYIAFSFVVCPGDEHFFRVGRYVVVWTPRR
jgi:hypothetical protein